MDKVNFICVRLTFDITLRRISITFGGFCNNNSQKTHEKKKTNALSYARNSCSIERREKNLAQWIVQVS